MRRVHQVLACSTAYGDGGLGRHFAQLVEEARAAGRLGRYYAYEARDGDASGFVVASRPGRSLAARIGRKWWATYHKHQVNETFDRAVAEALVPARGFTGFAGKAFRSMQRAGKLGADWLEVVAPNTHVRQVQRLHAEAARVTGVKDTWLGETQIRKTCKEYELADRVLVHSDYVWESLVEHGVPERKLHRTVLRVPARFSPPASLYEDGVFRMVYVGRLDATKGVTVLLDAFRRLPFDNTRLFLVGGWSSGPVRRLCKRLVEDDDRIVLCPGDPIPVLRRADVYVHPSFEDGYSYSAVEALACGVPVIVTRETGMKEYVQEGENGYVVPAGDADALIQRIEAVRQRPLRSTRPLLPSEIIADSERPEALAHASGAYQAPTAEPPQTSDLKA